MMNQPGDDFLANACLAGDEHLRIRASGAVDVSLDGADRIAATDEADFLMSSGSGQDVGSFLVSSTGLYLDRPTFVREKRYYRENLDIVNDKSCNFDVSIRAMCKLRIRTML